MLYFDPRRETQKQVGFPVGEPEMSDFESAFLCGLIREKKPKKIVEFGIAAGGTTAIMLECLSLLGVVETTELYSIDCRELFYRGNGEKSGYLAEEYKKVSGWKGRHGVFLGKYSPEVLTEIGQDIDFVVLDTVHRLPGEILDFLAVFPFLAPHACVVLHDIHLNHIEHPSQFATRLLLDTVVADKFFPEDTSREYGSPNIGAFVINDDTAKYIVDVFDVLSVTWNYIPDGSMYDLYLSWFERYYPLDLAARARIAYEWQSRTLCRQQQALDSVRPSASYRIGRMITFLPRRIKRLFVK